MVENMLLPASRDISMAHNNGVVNYGHFEDADM